MERVPVPNEKEIKPRQGVVANTIAFISWGVGFIVSLGPGYG